MPANPASSYPAVDDRGNADADRAVTVRLQFCSYDLDAVTADLAALHPVLRTWHSRWVSMPGRTRLARDHQATVEGSGPRSVRRCRMRLQLRG